MLALLRYWPTGNTGKEILFLNELEDLFEPLEPIHVRGYVKPLGRRLARCIASSCSQIVERVMYLWNSSAFNLLFVRDKQNVTVLAPLVYNALRRCSEDVSNASLRQMAIHVIGDLDGFQHGVSGTVGGGLFGCESIIVAIVCLLE